MSERYDYIAINAHGVYALCEDLPNDPDGVTADFIRRVESREGHRVERVPVAEAVERHKAFLAGLPCFAVLMRTPATDASLSRDGG